MHGHPATRLSGGSQCERTTRSIAVARVPVAHRRPFLCGQNGTTALHYAAFIGHVACVRALLEKGAKSVAAKARRGFSQMNTWKECARTGMTLLLFLSSPV